MQHDAELRQTFDIVLVFLLISIYNKNVAHARNKKGRNINTVLRMININN